MALLALPAYAAVDVSQFAARGSGSPENPWTGWDVAVTWSADTEYAFPSGYYDYAVSPNFLKTGIALRGEAGTVLRFTGTGNAVVFDNPGGESDAARNWTRNVRMENFIILGNGSTTNGLFLRGIRSGLFKGISVRDVTNAGIWNEAVGATTLEGIRVTRREMPNKGFNVVPSYGIVLASRGGDPTAGITIRNPAIEGVSSIGIWVKAGSSRNTIVNGASEGNAGKAMQLDGHANTVLGTVFSSNGGADVEVSGDNNLLRSVVSAGLVHVKTGRMNKVEGRFKDLAVSDPAGFTYVSDAQIDGAFIDYSATTIKFGNRTPASTAATLRFGGQARSGFTSQSFVGNSLDVMLPLSAIEGVISTDARRGQMFSTPLYGNAVLANPTNGVDGMTITWLFQQDVAGGRALSFGTGFESMGNGMPVLRQLPFSFTEMTARYNAREQKWQFP